MASSDDKERAQFEAWILSLPCAEYDDIFKRPDGSYFHLPTYWCWKAWQARSKQDQP